MPDDEKSENAPPPAEQQTEEDGPRPEANARPEGDDRFRPEAIAERVGYLGEEEETELDRLAREEEARLLERRKVAKKSKKSSALETAASKRLARIGETKVKRPSSRARAVDMADDDVLLARTAKLGHWLQQHQQVFGALIAAAILGGAGFLGWTYWQNKKNADASSLLAVGFADEHGTVAAKDGDSEDDDTKPPALYPTFKTAVERRDAAVAAYHKVESGYAGTGAAILARLSEGGLLLDKGDARAALGAYEDVNASPLAVVDGQVRGRALEGMGFAHELQAQADSSAPEKDKRLEDALGAYKQLEQVDVKGFKELAMFHEARVFQAKGDKAKAIELLKDVVKSVTEATDRHTFAYLQPMAEDRLRDLDPTAVPPKEPPPGPGGHGGGADMSDPRVKEMIHQLQQQMKQKGGGAGGANLPVAPPPAGAPPGSPP